MRLANYKFKKFHKLAVNKSEKMLTKKIWFNFGHLIVISLENGFLTAREIEATRRLIRRNLSKKSRIIIRPHLRVQCNKKSKGARMGKGVGKRRGMLLQVQKGSVLYEVVENKSVFLQNIKGLFVFKKMSVRCKLLRIHNNFFKST